MKVVAIIPARYESSRFEGKPLANICGYPMVWWTYQQVKKCKKIDKVIIATDDERIEKECKNLELDVVMTSKKHKMMLERIHEVSKKVNADIYLSIAGDEPLIEPEVIEKLIDNYEKGDKVINLRTIILEPKDVVNNTTMKVVTDKDGYALYASRSPIPYPKASLEFDYYKHMGMYALTNEALDFFAKNKRGLLESIEDFDLLRFLENGMKVKIIDVNSKTVSVDTRKDLKRVSEIIEKNIKIQK